MSSKPLV